MGNHPSATRQFVHESFSFAYAVNRQCKMPLQEQLYEILKGIIMRGEWKVGDQIPTELELMNKYKVSRIVVRQVLTRLKNEGYIFRQQGRGSFVAEATLEQALSRIISFTDDMHARGLIPGTKVIFSAILAAPEDLALLLQVPAGEELIHLERLRLANDEPMCIEESFHIQRHCPGLLAFTDTKVSLRECLEKEYGIRWLRAIQTIRAVIAEPGQARLLSIPHCSPLLLIEQVSYSLQNIPLEFLQIYYRGDRYSLSEELHR